MNLKEFKKLKEEEHYNPTLLFSVRTNENIKKDERYKHFIFNHVSLHFPFNAQIVEAPLSFTALRQESADMYKDNNAVKIILPLFVRPFLENDESFRYDKDMPFEYGNCAHFVREYLVKAGLLKEKEGRISVDELYFELYSKGFVVSTTDLNKWYFDKEEEDKNGKSK